MRINDDDFKVIEDTVDDFDYFYDDDEVDKRNKGIIVKYRIVSIGIAVVTFIFLVTLLGITRMKIYDTKNVLTHDEINYVETKKICDDVFKGVQTLYTSGDTECDYYIMYNSATDSIGAEDFASRTYGTNSVEGWQETLNSYKESLNSVTQSKKKDLSDYTEALIDVADSELNLLDALISNYDDITGGDTEKLDIALAQVELRYAFLSTIIVGLDF